MANIQIPSFMETKICSHYWSLVVMFYYGQEAFAVLCIMGFRRDLTLEDAMEPQPWRAIVHCYGLACQSSGSRPILIQVPRDLNCFDFQIRVCGVGHDDSAPRSSIGKLCLSVEDEGTGNDFVQFVNCLDQPLSGLHGSRGCLGCYTKPTPITAVDEPSKGLRIQGQTVKKPSASEDFWSTSTYDLDNSAAQSQRSISAISLSNQSMNHNGGTGSSSNHSDFVNHGLLNWNQTRLQWIANKKFENHGRTCKPRLSSWNVTYETLLGTNRRYSRPIPLSEMVEYLVDIWEHDGLYD
ncbi:uncharacterized protein LOC127805694 [Diospyros lotus]|uniref:uncharacterized protein LOC127805694 n=1 Tax=Diospyros lotus TaxID=55363 RepID=UPI002252F98E|nr:uncharacterized protein LOC127805694 [Diospyros lotus]